MRLGIHVFLLLIVFFISCNERPVHPSLWTIRKNKAEFRKVLDYYSAPKDSLKLQAAKFLIENVPKHYSFVTKDQEKVDRFFQDLEEEVSDPAVRNKQLFEKLRAEIVDIHMKKLISEGRLSIPEYRRRPDVKTVKADFLIENIEYAFKAWEFPWARSFSFEEFCQYILPYRYGREALSPWRKQIYEQFKWVADSVNDPFDLMEVATLIHQQFNGVFVSPEILKEFRLPITNQLEAMVFRSCIEEAGMGVSMYRALGIPSAKINIPLWGHRNEGHAFTGFLDRDRHWHSINFGNIEAVDEIKYQVPKMYVQRFDKMKNFRPVRIDVSAEFMDVYDIKVQLKSKTDRDIYLCSFGDLAWTPLSLGIRQNDQVIFKDVGRANRMYIAMVRSLGKLKPVSDVFSVDLQGNITYYPPNHAKLNTEVLTRKFVSRNNRYIGRLEALIGGVFSVSDDRRFTNRKVLYKVDTLLNYYHNIIECPVQAGKYFRYDFPQFTRSNLDGPAEIAFYTSQNGGLQKIEGEYFGSPQLSQKHLQWMTDEDVLTYVEVWACEDEVESETGKYVLRKGSDPVWLGLQADSATVVTHIGICPRNDKNGIYEGMRYELFYWDDKWKSQGKKLARGYSITFDGIPENSVLWLRNLDEGKEERIFTFQGGKQIWW